MLLVFMIFLVQPPVFSQGNIEIPDVYLDLGSMDIVTTRSAYDLLLPYLKPAGYDKILTEAHTSLVFHQLIVDRKVIKPQRNYGSDGGRLSYGKEAPLTEMYCDITLKWETLSPPPPSLEKIKKGICFNSYTTKLGQGIFIIPYGTKEVYLTYSVLIPKYKNMEDFLSNREYIYSDPQAVKWTINWP
jgi:hypothetical protein